jgi:hypothetical protein
MTPADVQLTREGFKDIKMLINRKLSECAKKAQTEFEELNRNGLTETDGKRDG